MQDLADRECAGGRDEVWPEVLANVLDGVYADAIDAVVADKTLDPRVHRRHDVVVLRVQIHERYVLVSEPALLDVGLVRVVGDEALRVEVGLSRERREVGVVWGVGAGHHVVHDDVYHQVHVTLVERGAEGLEVVGGAILGVQRVDVLRPISTRGQRRRRTACTCLPMVCLTVGRVPIYVSDNGGYPDRVKTKILDVVQLGGNALPRPATVPAIVGVAGRARVIGRGEAVSDQLETMFSIASHTQEDTRRSLWPNKPVTRASAMLRRSSYPVGSRTERVMRKCPVRTKLPVTSSTGMERALLHLFRSAISIPNRKHFEDIPGR